MATIKLKAQHEDSVIGKALELKTLIAYHQTEIIPFYDTMQDWEAKEYKLNLAHYTNLMAEAIVHIKSNEAHFDAILKEYGMTVPIFISSLSTNESQHARPKLVVIDENTLAVILKPESIFADVLHASVLKGACGSSPLLLSGRNVRLASEKDFDEYRVVFKGFNNPEEYEFAS